MAVFNQFSASLSQLTCQEKKHGDKVGLIFSQCDAVIQDQMLSTAQQMLQDSRSKIELIRLQIIKVTQAGSSSGGGGIGGDGGDNPNSSTHRGQIPGP